MGYPITTDVTASALATLITNSGLIEGTQYYDTTNLKRYIATSVNTVMWVQDYAVGIEHGTFSSAVSQTVIATNQHYPILFETDEDILGVYRATGTVSINSASPCTVTCVNPSTTVLVSPAPIRFTALSDVTKGISLATTYYITNVSGGFNTFQLSTTIALARAGTANVNTTGAITGTYECPSRIYFPTAGDYFIAISALMRSTGITGATPQAMDLWFVLGNSTSDKAGTNISRSNTQTKTDRSGIQVVVTVPFIIDVAAGDYIRLDYHGDDVRLEWVAVAAQTGPPIVPACPSIIMTVNKISN